MADEKNKDNHEVEAPALKGEVVEKKHSKLHKAFISEDIVDVKDYVFMDVFIPALKKLIIDIFYNGLNALFYGNSGGRPGGSKVSWLDYSKMSQSNSTVIRPSQSVNSRYNIGNIIFKNEEDAKTVLDTMDEILERYHYVSVADLYQQIKKNPSSIDFDWGWKDLRSAHVMYNRNGWILDLPKPISLKK